MLSASRRHTHIIHLEQVPAESARAEHGAHVCKRLWTHVPGQQIACTWYEVPPGAQALAQHFHSNCEEAVFILEGKGAARIGELKAPIAAGDYLAYPPGPAAAHCIINTGTEPLRYLCISTVAATDVVVYPDQGTATVRAGVDPKRDRHEQTPWIDAILPISAQAIGPHHPEGDDSISSRP